ncbi:SDR family NAD(P)-dependent oxidoreductase [Streptomyces xanthophaeus]|uniref:3-oxoacyl-ACP reductase n=1 Tax=Streptomyces xanthophaeus TaxID=67385 RepID=A0A919GX21_9ACTN|nr:SDR family NAD(P)-dependent oxidoreductase [Streptomyces xanthophaeus]GHI83229.1 3-oxoacyl-ACP reductase [Streptomyces xanthophaeus]
MTRTGAARRVLVTGGASGIGAAIVQRFLRDGDRVAVLDQDRPALERLEAQHPGLDLFLVADVSDPGAVEGAFRSLDRRWAGVDAVCNCAGISAREPFLESSLETWQRTLAVNLTGTFLVAQQAARRMAEAGSGVMVNISSVSGMVGMPGYAAYNVSKAGVIELTKTMALELAPHVRVNAICPGYILTPMQRAEYTPEMLADCAARIPLRRLGEPAEIADMTAYLCSPMAEFITGQSFVVDGGETAGGLASA